MAKPPSNSSSKKHPKALQKWFQKITSKAGSAGTGKAKARTTDQARAAAKARWDKYRAEKAAKEAPETPPDPSDP
jgi:hypothetical protein